MDAALATVLPYLTLEKPKKKWMLTRTSFLLHLVTEEQLMKTNNLLPPPVIGKLRYINMKLSWDSSQEFGVRAMLDCRGNVPIISQSFVERNKVPGVLNNHNGGLTMANGSESNTNASRAYTHACTQRCGYHFSWESFEISPLQSPHEIILPWSWIITHPTNYLLTGKHIDMKFDILKCKNSTAKVANKFIIEYYESVAYVGNYIEQVGVRGTLRFDDELHGQIEVQGEAVKDIMWSDRMFQSVNN